MNRVNSQWNKQWYHAFFATVEKDIFEIFVNTLVHIYCNTSEAQNKGSKILRSFVLITNYQRWFKFLILF